MQTIARWEDMDMLHLPLVPGPPSSLLRVDAANVALPVRITAKQRLTMFSKPLTC